MVYRFRYRIIHINPWNGVGKTSVFTEEDYTEPTGLMWQFVSLRHFPDTFKENNMAEHKWSHRGIECTPEIKMSD